MKASEVLSRLAAQRNSKVDFGELADALLEAFGGIRGLAQSVKDEFELAKPGSIARTSILARIMEVIFKAGENSSDPMNDLSQEDAAAAIAHACQQESLRVQPQA